MVCHEVVLMIEYQGLDMVAWGLRCCFVGGLKWGLDMVGGLIWGPDMGGLIW